MGRGLRRPSGLGRASPWAVVAALAGCGGEDGGGPPRVSVVDSAGVVHVRLATLEDLAAPRWTTSRVHTTAEGPTGVELYQVTAALFLPDGALAVANSGTQEVVVLGPSGGERGRWGGAGDGPGEFRRLNWLALDRSGHLLVYDPALGRLTTLDESGRERAARRVEPPSRAVDLEPLALLDDDRMLAIYGEARIFGLGGIARDTTPLLVFGEEGQPPDTLGRWGAQEWYHATLERGATRQEVGFGRDLARGGRDGFAVIGSTDSLDVTVYGPDGRPVMTVSGVGARSTVLPAEVEQWQAERRERLARAPEPIRRALADVPHRETHPVFAGLLLDDERRLWIGGVARAGEPDRRWLVLGPAGEVLGEVILPADARLLDVAGSRLAVLSRDELDQEHIVVLRLITAET